MYCDYPREIDSENFWFFLEKLEKLYRKDWPKHLVIRSSLQMFIHRFKKMPELMQRMKLFILSDNWENDGQFFVAVSEEKFSAIFYNKFFHTVYLHRVWNIRVFWCFEWESRKVEESLAEPWLHKLDWLFCDSQWISKHDSRHSPSFKLEYDRRYSYGLLLPS